MSKVTQGQDNDTGQTLRENWNEALKTVETNSTITGDGTDAVGQELAIVVDNDPLLPSNSPIIPPSVSAIKSYISNVSGLQFRIVVKQASDFGIIDSTKQYFLDGNIDMGSTSIEVPAGGIQIAGLGFDISGLFTSDVGATIFTSPVGGSGNIVLTDISLENTGAGSKTFDVFDVSGFSAIEISRVNFNNCVSLGEINNYRQGLENGTGRFGGTPALTLSGFWIGGFVITSSIVRGLTDGAYALFQAGAGFMMNSRFKTDMNVDLNATVALLDFTPAMFANPSTVQIQQAIITRLGVFNSADLTIVPNLLPSDLASSWTDNQGLSNTFEGGELTLTTEVETPIATQGVPELLLGTFTPNDNQHFDNPLQYQMRHIGNDPVAYTVDFNFVLAGQANDLYSIELIVDNGAPSTVFTQSRYVQSSPGLNDLGYFSGSHNVTLNNGDIVYWEIQNVDSAQACTLQLASIWDIRKR